MHIDGTEEWEDEEADIIRGNCIDVDFLNYTPELRDTPTAVSYTHLRIISNSLHKVPISSLFS